MKDLHGTATGRASRLADLFDPATVVLFAGLGGVCIGVEEAYVEGGYRNKYIDLCVNHWDTAVQVHELNHPMTQHLHADVLEVDPNSVLLGRKIAYLHASPDCTHHSKARGGKPKCKYIRALADVVLVWAAKRRPDVITLENVEEFADWGPLDRHGKAIKSRKGEEFRRWVRGLETLGYVVEWRELRACDYGVPTTRKRLFVIARCDGKPIVWPEKTHGSISERSRGFYRQRERRGRQDQQGCEPCRSQPSRFGEGLPGESSRRTVAGGIALKPYLSAASCIDWKQPMLSIFATRKEAKAWAKAVNVGRAKADRVGQPKRPLELKTHKRLAGGLFKWVLEAAEPFITTIENYGWNSSAAGQPASEPLSTVTAGPRGGKHAAVDVGLCPPNVASFVGTFNHGGPEHRTKDAREPLDTVTSARDARGVVNVSIAPHIVRVAHGDESATGNHRWGNTSHSAQEPLPTVAASKDYAVAGVELSAFTVPRHGEAPGQAPRSRSIEAPLPTVTGTDNGAQLVTVVLDKHYGGVFGRPLDGPTDTITAVDHHGITVAHLTTYHGAKGDEARGQDAREPLRTLDTENRYGIVAAHLIKFRGESPGTSAAEPMDTITAGSNNGRPAGAGHAMGVATVYLSRQYGSNTAGGSGDPAEPLRTITSGGDRGGAHDALCVVYLSPFYGEGSGLTGHTPAEPLPTVPSHDRFGLVSLETCRHWLFTPKGLARAKQVANWARRMLGKKVERHLLWVNDPETGKRFPLLMVAVKGILHLVTDILMRMLRPRELARAQGFPDWYVIDRTRDGTPVSKADQVKLIGNSVPPAFARVLAKANVVDQGVMEDAGRLVAS